MREIDVIEVEKAIYDLCLQANVFLPEDVKAAINQSEKKECGIARSVMQIIQENIKVAESDKMPLCQDTGMVVVFLEIGQDVHLTGGWLYDSINTGVAAAYKDGYYRASVVEDPIKRDNTGTNTPAIINTEIVPGDKIHIIVAPKGFGSENMGALAMLKPAQGIEGIKSFVLDTVARADANPCPPIVVGIGIGGTMDRCALLAKKALMRSFNQSNSSEHLALLEKELLVEINKLNIGPQGLGGKTTALAVAIESFPTHIAGLPVCVNINCHVARHAEMTL